MLIEELGEFGLIERIRQKSRFGTSPYDDAGVIPLENKRLLLATTDMLIEEVHFSTDLITPYEIGWRAMASNLSDIAAMGGVPTHFLVSLCLRPHTTVDFIDDLYKGMEELGTKFGLVMAGGDTNHGPCLIINITLLGEVEKKNLLTRKGAKDGNIIMVTGTLGGAECGLSILKRGGSGPQEMIKRHTMPFPRVSEARILGTTCEINGMIDISDGLVSDLYHLLEPSGLGARIYLDKLPISSALKEKAKTLGLDPIELGLYGGEEYELLFTTKYPDSIPEIGVPVTIIGEVTQDKGIFLVEKGHEKRLQKKGYTHF